MNVAVLVWDETNRKIVTLNPSGKERLRQFIAPMQDKSTYDRLAELINGLCADFLNAKDATEWARRVSDPNAAEICMDRPQASKLLIDTLAEAVEALYL